MADLEFHQELVSQFKLIDHDNSGLLTAEELRETMMLLSENEVTEEDVNRIIKEIDQENNKVINYSEFLAATIPQEYYVTEDRLKALFS